MTQLARVVAVLGAVILSGMATPASSAPAKPSGALEQLRGRAGCIAGPAQPGRHRCGRGHALEGVNSVAVSADGRTVYVASTLSESVTALARNRRTGALRQLRGRAGCVSARPRTGCATGRGLEGASSVTISPDGRTVYVASFFSAAIAVFARDRRTGALDQPEGPAGCVSDLPREGCTSARALRGPRSIAVSRDGRSAYVATESNGGVAAFARDPGTGALAQLPLPAGCVTQDARRGCAAGRALAGARSVTVSRDGRSVYVASSLGDAVAVFSRDRATGAVSQAPGLAGCVSRGGAEGCAPGRGLGGAESVAVSPDGRSVYVAASREVVDATGRLVDVLGGVAVLRRHRPSGTLAQPRGSRGCLGQGRAEGCGRGRGLDRAESVAVSPDGRTVYVAGPDVAVLARQRRRGTLAQLRGRWGCVTWSRRRGCARGRGLTAVKSVTVSRDGRSVYVAGGGAVAVFARGR